MPFGKESRRDKFYADPVEQARYTFSNHYKDEETGLIFMQARYYDPSLGRFITADTIVQDPTNPVTMNRYHYAGNNPVNNIDPNGHGFFRKLFKKIGRFFKKFGDFVSPLGRAVITGDWKNFGWQVLNIITFVAAPNPWLKASALLSYTSRATSNIGGNAADGISKVLGYASAASGAVGTGIEVKNAYQNWKATSGTLVDSATAEGGNYNSRIENLITQMADDSNVQFGDFIFQANTEKTVLNFAATVEATVYTVESSGTAILNTFAVNSGVAESFSILDNPVFFFVGGVSAKGGKVAFNVAKALAKNPKLIRQTTKSILSQSRRLFRVNGPAPKVTELSRESKIYKGVMDLLGHIGDMIIKK